MADCAPASPQDADAAQRYFRYFPQGLTYFEDLNFKLYRSVPRRFHYNGGFATARWLGTDRLLRPSTIDQATESQLIAKVDQTDPQRLSNLAGAMPGEEPPRVAGIDPYGLDLAIGERLKRIPFPRRLDTPEDVDGYLRRIP